MLAIYTFLFLYITYSSSPLSSDANCNNGIEGSIGDLYVCGTSDCTQVCGTGCGSAGASCCCGQIKQSNLYCAHNEPPRIISDNIIIKNPNDTQSWWVAFYIAGEDSLCGGAITNIEITDNYNYYGQWVSYDEDAYTLYQQARFSHKGQEFTTPITVRISKDNPLETIIMTDIITNFTGFQEFDSGFNFCQTTTPTPSITEDTPCTIRVNKTRWTDLYGGEGGDYEESMVYKEGIRGILSWGIDNNDQDWHYNALTHFAVENKTFGYDSYTLCDPFTLSDGEYINGYRVIYGPFDNGLISGTFVNGLVLHTNNFTSYNCSADEFPSGYTDTGDIIFNDSYLSGIYIKYGGVIDSISFQFTSIKNVSCNDGRVSAQEIRTDIDISYSYLSGVIIVIFIFIAITGLIDAKLIRKNDFFDVMAILSAMIQFSDMMSDIFFAVAVYGVYRFGHFSDDYVEEQSEFLVIFILSVLCIIIPIIISLYQLHVASSKHWLKEEGTRHWLLSYGKILYIVSMLSGSSFCAIAIFNSNLFDLDIFNIGLNRRHLMSWNTKRVYSVILFENLPQLLLSLWYTLIVGQLYYIPSAQMTFSGISIITTIMAMFLHKKIYFTQDFVYTTIDVTGQCITDNLRVCQRRIMGIKEYLSQSVLGVNDKSVDIEHPVIIPNGVQMRIHITYIHDKANINPTDNYYTLLRTAVMNRGFQDKIKEEWELESLPRIGNINCSFQRSKQKAKMSMHAKQKKELEGVRLEDTATMKQRSIEMMQQIDLNH